MSKRPGGPFGRFDTSQLRITRGAFILLFLQLGLSLVWLLSDRGVRADLVRWLAPTPQAVFEEYKVWTLLTGPILEIDFISLVLQAMIMWSFAPTLERWWGTRRFLLFAVYTSLAGTVAGTVAGQLLGSNAAIFGYDPFVYGMIVAFGILYGRQHVQFFGVIPMTGRQLMYGIIGFVSVFVLIGQRWEVGFSYATSMGLAALLTSGKWTPRLWWYKWRHRRAKSKLTVMDGGKARPGRGKPDEKLLN